ncbi:heterokaryon incompatibility protein-domain-containing protein [Lophiotrema nucula]|uniref:Heterokaryon incompatibility protein-domain-containing protein n=1 Tax=Lophiotrema nucula TaxID=690887 RepID=A0A6A5Z7J8_9PLEO|nr:heterokaryon incompatibility protein-domain-containing protein [Lophiotrema nucula]
MPLCWACSQIRPTHIGAREFRRENNLDDQPPKIKTYMLQPAVDLPVRARTCPFCALLYKGYGRAAARTESDNERDHQRELDSFTAYDSKLQKEFTQICFEARAPSDILSLCKQGQERVRYTKKLWIHSIVAFIPVEGAHNGLLEIRLRCFADEGTPAAVSEDITGCPPIPSADSLEAHKRTSSWLARCLKNYDGRHGHCVTSISGERFPRLPTRVIDVGSNTDGTSVRLIESHGLSARFWALSHCWGSPDKQPLKTTKATLSDRLVDIGLESLPKTFRDAITFTRNQGVRYLWIDSLCIIQDDTSDWERESKSMAAVYEQAEVVIVSADAENPQDGLFFDRIQHSLPVEMKYYYLNEDFNVRSSGSYFVWLDPTPRRPRGHCKTLMATGENWDGMIEMYSGLKFTYTSDRLVALEGLRSRFPNKSQDEYYFGLWRNLLPWSLVWRTKEKANRKRNVFKAPSWTWASVLGSIEFIELTTQFDSLVQDIRVDSSGRIYLTAMIKPAPRILRLLERTTTDPADIGSRSTTLAQLRDAPERLSEGDDFVICSEETELIGIAYLDEHELDELPGDVFVIGIVGFAEGSKGRQEDPGTAYRVLLVHRPSDLDSNAFTRVGTGKVYARWFEDSAELRDIILE